MLGDGKPWEVKKKPGPCPQEAYSLVEETDINQIIMLSNVKLQLCL